MHVDKARVGRMSVAPYLFQQFLPRENTPRCPCEGDKEVELQRGQRDNVVAAAHLMSGLIDCEVTQHQLLFSGIILTA